MAIATAGDPKRPADVKRYERPVVDPDQVTPDGMMLLGTMFGMAGVMLKVRQSSRNLKHVHGCT